MLLGLFQLLLHLHSRGGGIVAAEVKISTENPEMPEVPPL